ncbi:MAG: hypothetical protein IPP94_18490 [Ignavibacteria bacterium]|nr:hypothetical protein [Ignavibacteria bacterium]
MERRVHPRPSECRLLLHRFTGEGRIDDNGENVWTSMVYDTNKPVRGARQRMAGLLRSGASGAFLHQRDTKTARTLRSEELQDYPENWKARTELWSLLLREDPSDATKNTVKAELDALYEQHRGSEEMVIALLPFFGRTEQQDRADKIRKEWIEKNPTGAIADADARRAISRDREGARRADLIEA